MKETYILFIHNNIRGSVWDLQNREQYNRQKVQNKGLKQYRIEKIGPKNEEMRITERSYSKVENNGQT